MSLPEPLPRAMLALVLLLTGAESGAHGVPLRDAAPGGDGVVQDDDADLDTVPGDADRGLDPGLRQELESWAPGTDEWVSEELASDLGDRLKGVVKAAFGGAEPHLAPDDPNLAPGAEAVGFGGAPEVLDTRAVRTARVAPAEGARSPLPEALHALRAEVFPDTAGVRIQVKVVRVRATEDGGLEAEARLELDDPAAGRQLRARWAVRAERAEGGPLRVARLEELGHQRARRPEGPLFVDVTRATFGDARLEADLGLSLARLRERLDARLGVGILGHHGLALGDVNGDGLEDLYLCQPGGLPNRMLLRTPDGGLADVPAGHGADVLDPSRSALILHLDDDAHRDLVVAAGDRVTIFRGRGDGTFEVVSQAPCGYVTSMCAADFDQDGDLDLFTCGYSSPYEGSDAPLPYHDATNGAANFLLSNEGGLRFRDVTPEVGLAGDNRRFSFAASWEDFDDDGDPDLYVANDFGKNQLWRNVGGRFVDVAERLGVEDLAAGMGVSWGDVDGDARMDLLVSNMWSSAGQRVVPQDGFRATDGEGGSGGTEQEDLRGLFARHARGNSLFLNRGREGFVDQPDAGGARVGRWAWGATLLDLDNDGRLDLVSPNGFVTGALDDDL